MGSIQGKDMERLKVLIACEESQTVCKAFRKQGHEAYSADIQECSGGHPEWHIQGDVLEILNDGWDMMIAHPECRYLCLSSARWFDHPDYPDRYDQFESAVLFFMALQNCDIPRIAIENSQPLGRTIQRVGRPDQCVHPYHFGDPRTKGCYLWLKNLPPLIPTHQADDHEVIVPECHHMAPSEERSKLRSKFPEAIANAMALQWGNGQVPEFTSGLFSDYNSNYGTQKP